jgi:hypothetical protein
VNLRVPFVTAGLIELDRPVVLGAPPGVASWRAQLLPSGGSAAVLLREAGDAAVRAEVRALLGKLAAVPANGIARVVEHEELTRRGGFPGAAFLVEFAPGFYAGTALHGDLLAPATSKGTHGYWPDRPEMHAAFFVKGRGIAAQRLGVIDMRAIAPTLAAALGVELPSAEVPALLLAQR